MTRDADQHLIPNFSSFQEIFESISIFVLTLNHPGRSSAQKEKDWEQVLISCAKKSLHVATKINKYIYVCVCVSTASPCVIIFNFNYKNSHLNLKFCRPRSSWKWYNISDVLHSSCKLDKPLETQSKPSMRN